MEGAYKSRENFNEFSYLVEKILAKQPKNSSGWGLLEMVWKCLKNFEENRL